MALTLYFRTNLNNRSNIICFCCCKICEFLSISKKIATTTAITTTLQYFNLLWGKLCNYSLVVFDDFFQLNDLKSEASKRSHYPLLVYFFGE